MDETEHLTNLFCATSLMKFVCLQEPKWTIPFIQLQRIVTFPPLSFLCNEGLHIYFLPLKVFLSQFCFDFSYIVVIQKQNKNKFCNRIKINSVGCLQTQSKSELLATSWQIQSDCQPRKISNTHSASRIAQIVLITLPVVFPLHFRAGFNCCFVVSSTERLQVTAKL